MGVNQQDLRALYERLANKPDQIDNAKLYVGSPMYFYCEVCAHQSDILPESYTQVPKKLCTECQKLLDASPGMRPAELLDMAKRLPPVDVP